MSSLADTLLAVTFPEPLRKHIDARVASGRFPSAEDYLRQLVERDRTRLQRLEALLDEGIESGEPIEVDDAFWTERQAELERRLAAERPS